MQIHIIWDRHLALNLAKIMATASVFTWVALDKDTITEPLANSHSTLCWAFKINSVQDGNRVSFKWYNG